MVDAETLRRAPDFESFAWLRSQCEFRIKIVDSGFSVRESIAPGDVLYDPQVRWADDDGTVVVSDIGGQPRRGFDPDQGYGAIYRLTPDEQLVPIVPLGNMGRGMPIRPMLAPPSFGQYGGDIFFVGQQHPGRAGAHNTHLVYRVRNGADRPEPFASLVDAGSRAGGKSGGSMPGVFGLEGTEHEGYFFCNSQLNLTVYRVGSDGVATPFITLDEQILPFTINPFLVFYAPPHWGPSLRGTLMVGGMRGTSFDGPASARVNLEYWRLTGSGQLFDPTPIKGVYWGISAAIAPQEFKPYGGHLFFSDAGTTNVLQSSKPPDGALPYDACIYRWPPDGGEPVVFAEGLQGASNLVFSGRRLVVSSVRRSYSTGEYHEPDGSIYEVRSES